MKKLSFLMALAATLCLSAHAQNTTSKATNDMKNKKSLVVYFSATGTTEKAAQKLAEIVGADLFRIEPKETYSAADLDWNDRSSRSSMEMNDKKSRPAIGNEIKNLADYDTVFIGFPIWWYVAPRIINTFIESNNLKGKTLYPFATSGGSGISDAVKALKADYPDLDWRNGKLLNRINENSINGWL